MTTPQVPIGFYNQRTSSHGINPATPGAKPVPAGISLPMKLTAVLFLPMVLLIVYLFMGEQLGLNSKHGKPAPSAASRGASASNAAPASAASSADELPASAERASDGKRSGAADALLQPSGDEKQKGAGGRTLQREAADAVAAGAYGRAAKLYEELARKYPNKPAYAEAALIMHAKTPGP